ncbi:hypothetical protein JCM5176_11760 [Streptococcus sobrinus]|uniref:Uncharacterized protein n=1 Tax=Streptococcus sobrinus W1703 TaxID=1227275 RepID=U2J184_9STRE|nr:hypothetical protein [Streptococcus sobrinus]ERJ73817.1 hypothetical protein HMPREF1557_02114 [Streptococcus sobrinus W1703]
MMKFVTIKDKIYVEEISIRQRIWHFKTKICHLGKNLTFQDKKTTIQDILVQISFI